MKIHIDTRNKVVAINVQEDTHFLFETIEIDTIDVAKFENTQVYECYYDKSSKSIVYDFVARGQKLWDLWQYDKSIAVNSFMINGLEMWLSKEERTSLTTLANASQKLGQATMQLQIKEGVFVELPTEQVLQILAMIELYAGQCYTITQKHIIAIAKLETVKEIEEYDFTQGYPEKLNF